MDKFEALRAFVEVSDEGGFAAAARELGTSRSAISRLIAALEDQLGVQLLNRTTRKTALTESGATYLERARIILSELNEAERLVADLQNEPSGALRINGPMTFGTMYLADAVAEFMALYPQLTVNLVLNDRFVDPMEEGFDLTVRIANLPDSNLIARRVAPIHLTMAASPAYLDAHSRPRVPGDLRQHKVLHYGAMEGPVVWKLTGSGGQEAVQVDAAMCSNNGEVLRAAALRGLGIVRTLRFVVAEDLRNGSLVPVLEGFEPPSPALYCVYPPNRFLPGKVRQFIDFLVQKYSRRQPWGG
jgi:DNA-binding transcriptional LysR family regulator